MIRDSRQKLTLFCVGLALLFPACKEAGPENTPSQEKQWELSDKTLVNIIREEHYTPEEFVESLGSPSFTEVLESIEPNALPWADALIKAKVLAHVPVLDRQFDKECNNGVLSKRCWEIQSYIFTYRTQTVDGRDVVLSARVTFPNNTVGNILHQVKTLSLHFHQGFFSSEWTPSESLMFMPLKALWDSAVIEPDLQKWGITHGIEADGGGSGLHMARQMADCTVAALEVMRQHGVSLAPDGYTTNWGSSQSAVPALIFARWYEEEAPQWYKDALRLHSTFSGEGAIDMPAFIEHSYKHPELIPPLLTIIVAYIKAFSPEQLGGYSPNDFVPQWYIDTKYEVNGREITFYDAVSFFYTDIVDPIGQKMTSFDEVVAPDMLTPDGEVDMDCPKIRAWMACLKKHNKLEGWTPEHPVFLAHSQEDGMIPYELAYNLYRTLSNEGQNTKVHMMNVSSLGDFPTGGLNTHFVISFMVQIHMACMRDPSDMLLIYNPVK